MKQILLIVSLSMLIGTQASAVFFPNRQAWDGASYVEKRGFVQGVFDEMLEVWSTDTQDTMARKRKVYRCAADMALTDTSLVEIVDSHYSNLENWGDSANIALRLGLFKICKVYK